VSKPESQQRIALFGGTFDPVHAGHLAIARRAVAEVALSEVAFLPCRQSPHKTESAGAGERDGLEMLEIATRDLSWATVSAWEYEQPIPSYSWKTAEAFRERYPEAELFWLLGADQWRVLASWNRADYLASLVRFIVHDRDGELAGSDDSALFLSGDHPASSSQIRDWLGRGKPVPEDWLPPGVGDYLRQKGLYCE
jgi:nicotinate-nucleotide adenylyltransferase